MGSSATAVKPLPVGPNVTSTQSSTGSVPSIILLFAGSLRSVAASSVLMVKVVFNRWRSCGVYGERGARAYSVSLRAEPQVGSRGKAFDQGPEAGGILIYVAKTRLKLECGQMPNVMAALPNIGGGLCSTPQSLADAHY